MTKLIYITHPEVIINPAIAIDEWVLSPLGWDRVEKLLALKFWQEVEKVYTSSEPKAYMIGEKVSKKYGIELEKISDLREIDRSATGIISPLSDYMQVVQLSYENIKEMAKGWESISNVMLRNSNAVEMLKTKYNGKTFVIIGHGCAGTTIKCHIKKVNPTFQEDPQKTGCYFIANLDTNEIIQDWSTY